MHVALAIIILLMGLTDASASSSNPIRYKMKENNRLFLSGDATRFIDDLNTYLRCVDKKTNDGSAACRNYLETGTINDILVPNLRTGLQHDAYRVPYDKVRGEYPKGYVMDGRRQLTLFVDEKWRSSPTGGAVRCRWRVNHAGNETELSTASCSAAEFDIILTLSESGEQFSYSAVAALTLEYADGSKFEFTGDLFVRDILIVAMGDSYSAGEGNPEQNHTSTVPSQWLDFRCHRSVFSYPAMTASALALADPRHSVTLLHVACSGAQTTEGVLETYPGVLDKNQAIKLWSGGWWWDRFRRDVPEEWRRYGTEGDVLPSQIDQVTRLLAPSDGPKRKPELLLISIGANDIGLASLLKKLATESCEEHCLDQLRRWRTREALPCDDRTDRLRRSFACFERQMLTMRTAINETIRPQHVFLLEYLDPLHDSAGDRCMTKGYHRELLSGFLGAFGGWLSLVWSPDLSTEEVRYADEEFFAPLKVALSKTATAPNWTLLRPADEEQKRGFCADPSWYHTYAQSKLRQHLDPGRRFDSDGTLHPNAFGQYFAMVRVLSRLRRDKIVTGHNISLMEPEDFSRKVTPDNKHAGFAWHIWARHYEDVSYYYRF